MTLNLADRRQEQKCVHWNQYETKRHNENMFKDHKIDF